MSLADSSPRNCPVCGFAEFVDHLVLWPELIAAWELSADEVAVINRQQGRTCKCCGVNWRSMSLAAALMSVCGYRGLFWKFVKQPQFQSLRILEVNPAGLLTPWLSQLRGHQLVEYPAVDIQSLPMSDGSFDIVVHSDTLEHVPEPLQGLSECRRVLSPVGACCFTIPMLTGRMSRSCAGRPPSYHGNPKNPADYRVYTEFGADAWTWPARAGFPVCEVHVWEYPSAMTLIGHNNVLGVVPVSSDSISTEAIDEPAAHGDSPWREMARNLADCRSQLQSVLQSKSWKLTKPIRWAADLCRGWRHQ